MGKAGDKFVVILDPARVLSVEDMAASTRTTAVLTDPEAPHVDVGGARREVVTGVLN